MLRGRTASAQVSWASASKKEKMLIKEAKAQEGFVRSYRPYISSVVDLTSVCGSFGKNLYSNWEEEKVKRATSSLK